MIGMFIGGFVTGAFVCFFTLFIIAICSIKSKERKLKEAMGGVKLNYSPFKPYKKPFNFYAGNLDKYDLDGVKNDKK